VPTVANFNYANNGLLMASVGGYVDDYYSSMAGATWPVMDMIDEYGVTALLTEPECQKRVFCEMVQLGRGPDGNAVQRSLWNAVIRYTYDTYTVYSVQYI
jgi:hypothetical protein